MDKIISRVLETVVGVRATVPEAAVRQARGQWQDDRCTWERCVRLRGQPGPGQANKVVQALRLCGLKGKGSRVDAEDFVLRKEKMMSGEAWDKWRDFSYPLSTDVFCVSS